MSLLAEVRPNAKNGSLKNDQTLSNYFQEFRGLQQAPVKLLELGVLNGASLKVWKQFFPNGSIYGVDREIAFGLRGQKEVRYFLGEQQDTAFLDRIARKAAPDGFDIIIDDCSHVGELSKISFWHLFENHLKPGGVYAIEDWLTGYLPEWQDGHALDYDPKDAPPNEGRFHGHQHGLAGFTKELVDEFARRLFFTPVPDPSRESRIGEMKFFEQQVFIYKGPRPTGDVFPTPSPPLSGNAQSHYVTSLPSPQNALDIFRGEWSSSLPGPFRELSAGRIPLFEDPRIRWFIDRLGGIEEKTVLELGPLEAGHTSMLDRAGAASILAIEANSRAYLKCLVVKELLGLQRARFLCGDFVEYLRANSQKFDVCLASGVLYHMTDPVELIALLARVTDRVCLWTQYYDPQVISRRPDLARQFSDHTSAQFEGFRHTLHRRIYEQEATGWQGFCGGMRPTSCWLSRQDILNALKHFGLGRIDIGFDDPNHPHGPSFALTAVRA